MAVSSVGFGWVEVLLILLGGSGLVGMPPGERDPALMKSAPQQSLAYVEWAARGPGMVDAPGIDGFAADPEILALIRSIETALVSPDVAGDEELQGSEPRSGALRLAKLVTGHPGSLFVIAGPPPLPNRPKGLLNVMSPAEILTRFHACLIVNAAGDAAEILDGLGQVVHAEIPERPQMHELATTNGLNLTIHQQGDRLLIGFGPGIVERALIGLRGEAPGLDTNPRFMAGWKRVAMDRVGSIAWIDVKSSAEVAIQSLGPAGMLAQTLLRGAGADALDNVVSGTGVINGDIIQRTFIATSGRTDGVLMLAGSPALRLEQLSHIRADSDVVLATSLDLAQVVGGMRDLVAKTSPLSLRVFDEAIHELETELGLHLDRDVYPAFGNAWTAFSSPSAGGLQGSNLIVALEVRDPAKAQVIYERLMQLLEQSLVTDPNVDYGPTVELRRQEFLGHSIDYVRRSGASFGSTVSAIPSFCMTRGHVLFALHPQALKSHLRYQSKPQPGFDTVARKKLPLAGEGLLFASYIDGAHAVQTIGGLAPFLGQTMTEMALANGWDFDPYFIPSTAALVSYSGDVGLSIARQRDGLSIESKNPQIGLALIAAFSSVRSWLRTDYEMLLETNGQEMGPAENGGLGGAENAGLGAAEGQVVPAAAVQPAAEEPKESPAGVVARRLTPLLLRALVPDGYQPLIPDDVYQRLAQPPSPEAQQQREERKRLNEERRRERALRRRPLPQQ